MQQLTYVLNDKLSPEEMGERVVALPTFQNARSRLQIVFSPSSDRDYIQAHMDKAREVLPNTTIVGMTTMGPTTSTMRVQRDVVSTFLLFDEAEAHVSTFDCHNMTPAEAGRCFVRELDAMDNPKAVFCTSACVRLGLDTFIEEVSLAHPDVPLFGAMAGTQNVNDDQSLFFANSEIFDCGIMAVTFCGKNLHAQPAYNLGWRPVGNEHIVTKCEGTNKVLTIDDEPAVGIYKRYLGIEADPTFFNNAASFPLVIRSGKHLVARVPIQLEDDGGLLFPAPIERGEHISFSYAHPDHLMSETRSSANHMGAFEPEALLLFSCINRRMFLDNDLADEEISFYRNACPSMAWAYGYGELYRSANGGGHLNSTIVAMGLREGPSKGNAPQPLADPNRAGTRDLIPLSERLATLLETTTNELNDTIAELETIAKRDQLTGAVNRRRMDEVLHYELSKRQKEDYLVLLMYDIDFFKKINDTYGHAVGDIVLKDLTRCVQGCIRSGDTLGRWGGEEFLCLLTGLSLDQARMVAERIRQRVEQTTFLRVGKLTVSIGLTAARPNDTPATFFQRVDKAMYDAKHAGRNCIRVR